MSALIGYACASFLTIGFFLLWLGFHWLTRRR